MKNHSNTEQPTTVIVKSKKSVGVSLLLTFLFGPLGMFYSTIVGALVMIGVNLIAAVFTAGLGLIVTWPITMIWGAIAASNHNKKLGV